MAAPPMPWAARATVRNSALWANPQSSDPAVKIPIPVANINRRPTRSATDPAVSRSAAKLSA